jgi:hypothetical protein
MYVIAYARPEGLEKKKKNKKKSVLIYIDILPTHVSHKKMREKIIQMNIFKYFIIIIIPSLDMHVLSYNNYII